MTSQKTLDGKKHSIELDEKLKKAVMEWRQRGYDGATNITKRLISYWFLEDHYDSSGKLFNFWQAQREAIEALIYVYEVAKYDRLSKLKNGFEVRQIPQSACSNEKWPKYAFKMATGSGKTFVMELAIVWQYFNKIFNVNNGVRYSSNFLVIAPNLIVFDRLKESFENCKELRKFPFVPPEWQKYFDIQVIFQSERVEAFASGAIFLTNVQQLYEKHEEYNNPVDKHLGPKPRDESDYISNWEYLFNKLSVKDDLLIINDEAHHVHSDDLEWNKIIEKLNDSIQMRYGVGLLMQLDFSATPKNLKGEYFPHIIYDYPLAQAIRDKKVKRPHIGIIEGVPKPPKIKDFIVSNKAQIDVGLKRLEEIKKQLNSSGKKPVLFITCDTNNHADVVGEYIEEQGYAGKVLVIHTDSSGNIIKKDLPVLREKAKNIDTNEYEVIVSVMMLKEGWDVKNVVVIVPLRALKSPILPEQILGRGLRRIDPFNDMWDEKLIVIDHPSFRQLWDAEIKMGDLEADIEEEPKITIDIKSIFVEKNKLQYDFGIPIVEGGLIRCVPKISELDVAKLPSRVFTLSQIEVPKIMYREKDLISNKIVDERELAFDYTDNFDLYLSYIVKAILKKTRLPDIHFSTIASKVEDYIKNYLFDVVLDTTDPEQVKKLNVPYVREKIREIFSSEIIKLSTVEAPTYITREFHLKDSPTLHTTKSSDKLHKPLKSVFNLLPADSIFEVDFMRYLDSQPEVIAYTKVMKEAMPVNILYYDDQGYLHYYIPDFIIKAQDRFYLIETKGEEYGLHPNVKYKDRAATEWCNAITRITRQEWKFVKIMCKDFQQNGYRKFTELIKVCGYTQQSLN